MNDIAFVAIIIAFFGLARVLVGACERIIGPDVQEIGSEAGEDTAERPVAA
ncbi:MAG: hypothetical protein M3011_01240 [Actinomycetota bacterium]|nr:hypothetical protein [Actinomycetota bacterium]